MGGHVESPVTFNEWLETHDVQLKQIERDTKIGYTSLWRARTGSPLRYPTAKKLVDYCAAIGGPPLDLESLCDPKGDVVSVRDEPPAPTGTDGA